MKARILKDSTLKYSVMIAVIKRENIYERIQNKETEKREF